MHLDPVPLQSILGRYHRSGSIWGGSNGPGPYSIEVDVRTASPWAPYGWLETPHQFPSAAKMLTLILMAEPWWSWWCWSWWQQYYGCHHNQHLMSMMLIRKTMITTMMANDIAQAMFVQLLLNIVTNQYNTNTLQYRCNTMQINIVTNQAPVNSSHTPKTAKSHLLSS